MHPASGGSPLLYCSQFRAQLVFQLFCDLIHHFIDALILQRLVFMTEDQRIGHGLVALTDLRSFIYVKQLAALQQFSGVLTDDRLNLLYVETCLGTLSAMSRAIAGYLGSGSYSLSAAHRADDRIQIDLRQIYSGIDSIPRRPPSDRTSPNVAITCPSITYCA